MKIWLVKVGEPVPTDSQVERPHRTGILAARLSSAGHEVTWWCSTFNHASKTHRSQGLQHDTITETLSTIQLHGRAYHRNTSLARILNHRDEAQQFALEAPKHERPDVILSAYPTINLSVEAVRYGREHGVPVVLDVRDLWPDIFADVVPPMLRPLARVALAILFGGKSFVFRHATAVVGTSESFVDWGLAAGHRIRTTLDRAFPHGYPVAKLSEKHRADAVEFWRGQFGGEIPQRVVCFFGNFSDHVLDLDTVLGAARLLEAGTDAVTFVLCGTGPSHARLSQLASGLRSVLLPGRMDAAQIRVLMEHSRVGLLPYQPRWDFVKNLPNKAIEYLSAGLPIVTCLSGEVENLICAHDCGAVYESDNPSSLAAAIRMLIADERGRESRRARAQALFDDAFDAERVYAHYTAHLEEIAQLGANR